MYSLYKLPSVAAQFSLVEYSLRLYSKVSWESVLERHCGLFVLIILGLLGADEPSLLRNPLNIVLVLNHLCKNLKVGPVFEILLLDDLSADLLVYLTHLLRDEGLMFFLVGMFILGQGGSSFRLQLYRNFLAG
jgi:hypothetical protein